MDSKTAQKRAPRPPVKKVVTSALVSPPISAPEPEVVAPKRTQTNKAIGICISAARSRRHIDKLNLNAALDTHIKELKAQIAPYTAASAQLKTGKITHSVEKELEVVGRDRKVTVVKKMVEEVVDLTDAERASAQKVVDTMAAQAAVCKSKITALSHERTRFSSESSIVLAIVCDNLVQQLVGHTMDRALEAKKKIIQVSHLHEAGVEALPLYPLIASLPLFKFTASHLSKSAATAQVEKALASALAQAEKDFKKKYEIRTKKKASGAAVVEAAAEPEPEAEPEIAEDASPDCKTTFRFYVQAVCKEMAKRDEKYKAIRVSTDIRGYLSDLLVEFIQRISSLVLLTANSMKNKTVSDVAILRTLESLLIDGHVAQEAVVLADAQIPDPVLLKAALANRDEAKKTDPDYKFDPETIPKVAGFAATRTITYPTSGYSDLAAVVAQKLALYNALSQTEKAEVVGIDEAEVAALLSA